MNVGSLLFFFKQKTAYEIRISDWSSDVCSSDLIERVLDTIDSSMPGGHAIVAIDNLRVPADQMLGASGEGFKYAQVRLSPARLSHRMRWHGSATRATALATDYACRRQAFGKTLLDHEGVAIGRAHVCTPVTTAHLVCP